MFKKILVPVDLAEEGLTAQAIDVTLELAKVSDSELRFVTVHSQAPATLVDYITANFDDQIRYAIELEIANVTAKVDYSPKRLSTTVRFGSVYHEVLAEAGEWGADLIIVGSHRPRMANYLIGSNAETIVRHAKCSVLVMRR